MTARLISASVMVVMTVLSGCGGGTTAPGGDDPIIGTQTPAVVGVEDIVANPIPFEDAVLLDDVSKQVYLNAINDARSVQNDCGTDTDTGEVYGLMGPENALVWNDKLYSAAYEHSVDLAESDTFSHDGSGSESDWTAQVHSLERGSTTEERILNNEYIGYTLIGENITVGFEDRDPNKPKDTAEMAVKSWLASPGHCANLMNPSYKEVGMAYVEQVGTAYTHYWTQNFGAQ